MTKPKRTYNQAMANHKRAATVEELDKVLDNPPPYSSQPPSEQASSSNVGTTESTHASTSAFGNLDFTPSLLELPTASECITHLKLLRAFANLRHEVGNMEGLYGIHINQEKAKDTGETVSPIYDAQSHQPDGVHAQHGSGGQYSEDEQAVAALAERYREKRWTIFVTKAVDRFEKWWNTLPSTSAHFPSDIRTTDFDSTGVSVIPSHFPTKGSGLGNNINSIMPPLDVLMVWHSFMLNPRTYLEDCMRLSRHQLWHTPFPWELINSFINNETFEYRPPDRVSSFFEKSTKLQWYYLNENTPKTLSCPKCQKKDITVPWTRVPPTSSLEAVEAYLTSDTGYVGEAFQEECPVCNLVITHEKLRVAKFITDAEALRLDKRPLPGTILNSLGFPQTTVNNKRIGTHEPFFPNRVVETLAEFQPNALRERISLLSIEVLKQQFQQTMRSPGKVAVVNVDQYKKDLVAKESKVAVRKMLSHYWDNSSPFGLDLVGAVIRQGSFVEKMRKIDWLNSPAAMSTIQRLIVKYHRFIRIIADNPKKIAVPTLDVDLAWHTHQLNPSIYYGYTVSETKKFLNHDDKIPESSLHTSFQWTSNTYEKKYGQPYSECACWYCECTREPLRSSFTNRVNPFRDSKMYDLDVLVDKGLPKDPSTGVHVSAHNAIIMDGRLPRGPNLSHNASYFAQARRRELEELDLQYAKVCKRYQKKKKADETPSRDSDAYIYGAYGYPMYYPVYVPYYAEPTCEGDRYTSGSGGGCAAGTCAGSASLGACAGGDGTPGCSASCGGHGDASGGCGSCGGGGGGCGGGCGG